VRAFLEQDAFELVLSSAIVAEVDRALESSKIRRYIARASEARLWLADIAALADLVGDIGRLSHACRDPNDEFVLAAATEGRAQAIVTGDADLLTLVEHEGIAIVTPKQFLEVIIG
jgi:putative PIN family toxin of toxin-antitoxin system